MGIKKWIITIIIILSFCCILSVVFVGNPFFNLMIFTMAIGMFAIFYKAAEFGFKNCEKKIKNAEALLKDNPQNPEACYDLGVLYFLRDIQPIDRQQAMKQFEYFVRNFPNHPLKREAERAIRRLKGRFLIFHYLTGRHGIRLLTEIYRIQGNAKDAIAVYKQNLETNPEDRNALFGMATALSQLGKYDEAIEYLKGFQDLAKKVGVMDLKIGMWQRGKEGNIFKQNIEKLIKKLEQHEAVGSFEEEFAMSSEEKNRIKRTLKILLVGALLIGIILVLMKIIA